MSSFAGQIYDYLSNIPQKAFLFSIPGLVAMYMYKSSNAKEIIKTRQQVKMIESAENGMIYKNQYINTSFGQTYAEQWTTNNENGFHILCVHGFSTANALSADFIPFLIDQISNTKTITIPIKSITSFHLYGRGLSDAPLVPNTLSLFLSQINDVLVYFELNGPLIVCGLSMGGAISTAFANKYPHRIHKLCLLAPAGFTRTLRSRLLLHIPFIPDLIVYFAPSLVRLFLSNNSRISDKARNKFESVIRDTLKYHDGYVSSMVSTLKHFPMFELMDTFNELYERNDFDNKRWLFVWGTEDKTCPIKKDSVLSDVEIIKVPGVGHDEITVDFCIEKFKDRFIQWINKKV